MRVKRRVNRGGHFGLLGGVGLSFGVACAALAAALLVPTPAMAADWIKINGERYEAGAPKSDPAGDSWEWDGDSTLKLKDYDGGAIGAGGKLDIVCEGENSVKNADGEQSALWQKGDGTLAVKGPGRFPSLPLVGSVYQPFLLRVTLFWLMV